MIGSLLTIKMVSSQVKTTDPIPDSIKQLIIGYTGGAINQFKAQLCPQFNDSISYFDMHHNLVKPGSRLLYPNISPFFKYNFEIKRWPEDNPYINFFIVTKRNNIMTQQIRVATDKNGNYSRDKKGNLIYAIDTFSLDIPCYKYFPFDTKYLVYFDTIRNEPIYFSGNVNQTYLAFLYKVNKYKYNLGMAQSAADFRMVQYSTSQTKINFIKETTAFYEFYATHTVLRDFRILIRIPKTDPYHFGNTWEMIYYTNTKDVPGNNDQSYYEVKFVRSIKPMNNEELFPKYRKLYEEEKLEVIRKYGLYTEIAPLPEAEPEVLK